MYDARVLKLYLTCNRFIAIFRCAGEPWILSPASLRVNDGQGDESRAMIQIAKSCLLELFRPAPCTSAASPKFVSGALNPVTVSFLPCIPEAW